MGGCSSVALGERGHESRAYRLAIAFLVSFSSTAVSLLPSHGAYNGNALWPWISSSSSVYPTSNSSSMTSLRQLEGPYELVSTDVN